MAPSLKQAEYLTVPFGMHTFPSGIRHDFHDLRQKFTWQTAPKHPTLKHLVCSGQLQMPDRWVQLRDLQIYSFTNSTATGQQQQQQQQVSSKRYSNVVKVVVDYSG